MILALIRLAWSGFMASSKAKVGTGIVAGGGTLMLAFNLFGARLDDMNKKIDDKDKSIREYVDFRHDQVMREILYIRETQTDIRDTLKDIERRMYNKQGNKSDD
jgi:DNA anti-recombination protein RmuC